MYQINASKETSQILGESKLPNTQDAFDKLAVIAQKGGMDAQYVLCESYSNGIPQIVNADKNESFKWCKVAAQQGHGLAQWILGRKYKLGIGTEENAKEAEKWYYEALDTFQHLAENGDSVALCTLGQILEDRNSPVRDSQRALSLYQLSAKQNYAEAQYLLGRYYDGKGDYKNAKIWFTQAAQQGYGQAQYALASTVYTTDPSERERLYIGAAESGLVKAQCELAAAYEFGREGLAERDLNKALAWYQRAADQGYKNAPEYVERVKKKLSSQNVNMNKSSASPDKKSTSSSHETTSSITVKNYQKALDQIEKEKKEAQELCDKLFAENPALQKQLKKASSSAMIAVSIFIAIGSLFVGLFPIGILIVIFSYISKKRHNKKYEEMFYTTASDELKAACRARFELQEKEEELREKFEQHMKKLNSSQSR